ncbi:MAG TPA: hypothetical protein VEA63_05860, partial [Opitutus sp.]|nr:hypothetical protein [Opitutus sp.]
MILEDSGEVKLYYGAADTSVALATASLEELLARCEPYDASQKTAGENPLTSRVVLPAGQS